MSSTGPAPLGFQRVLARFSTRLTVEEAQNFRFTTLNDVHQVIVDIQEQQARRKGMRNLSRVLRFVEAMDQFGKVVEIFLNSSSILPFVWGPIKFLLQTASTWAYSFDTLLDAYQQIAENIPLLLQYQTLFEQSPHMAKILEMMYEDILEFHQSALRMFGKSILQQVFRAAWNDFKSRFQHILDDLHRHKGLIESQANVLQIQQAQAARTTAGDAFKKLLLAQRKDQYLVTQNWLSAVNMKVDQEGFSNMRVEYPSTGKWILKNEKINLWMDPSSSAVPAAWINGIPGAGKTILTSLLIEEAQRNPLVSVLFFYCKHKDPQRNNFVAVTRAMLSQLLVRNRDEHLLPFLYEQSLDSGEMSLLTFQLCNDLLRAALDSLPQDTKTYIIIDGIDECDPQERRHILSTFSSIISNADRPGRIRGVFVSQDEPDIKKYLRTAINIRLTESDNKEDIKCFTEDWASKIASKFTLSPDKRAYIVETVCQRTEGMFLFAKLVLKNLYSQTTRGQLYNELLPERFPHGLNQAYERIVERIYRNENEAEREQAQKVLGWLVCAKRPLKWHEIQGAMSIDVEQQTVDFEEGQLMLDAQELCGSLVERLPGDRIELVHSTAKIYLAQDNYIRIPREESRLASLCLQYLTFESFDSESQSDETLNKLVGVGFYAFLDYAILHWIDHLERFLKTLEIEDLDNLEAMGPTGQDFAAINGTTDALDTELVQAFGIKCEAAREQASFGTFVSLIDHVRRTRSDKEDLLALGELGTMLSRVRCTLESMIQSGRLNPAEKESLEVYYGRNWFKCPRHLCFYFHEGFPDARSRDQHLSKHDRPFCCSHDGCSRIQTGFSTEKLLKAHLKKMHPDPESLSWKFPKGQQTSTSLGGKTPSVFQCTLCPKRFTRAYALRSHLRTHTDERPFVCTVCGKAFARQNDCRRHEILHSGEKKFVCKGELVSGGLWGCGRRFSRANALARHFRSEAGRICIGPLTDEEAAKKERQWEERQQLQRLSPSESSIYPGFPYSDQYLAAAPNFENGQSRNAALATNSEANAFPYESNLNYTLPAALLAQYPALTNLNWADVTPTDVELEDEQVPWILGLDHGISNASDYS